MMTTNILFLGMNRVSTSLGLAMKKNEANLSRTGYDPDANNIRIAIQAGALDQSVEDPKFGAMDADVILYALPAGKMFDVIGLISQSIKHGCFFVGMNPIGHDTFSQVSKILPDPKAFIAWVAALNPKYMLDGESSPASAHEDLFHGSQVYIAGDYQTHPEALKLGNDLAILAGAQPINIEPEELAGILALGHDLPLLISSLTTGLVTSEPGWIEARKLAGFNFARLSGLLELAENQALPENQMIANRRNIQRLLNQMIEQLTNIRDELENPDSKILGQIMRNSVMAYKLWQRQRMTMSWVEQYQDKPEVPGGMADRLFGTRRK